VWTESWLTRPGDFEWAGEFLEQLHDMAEKRNILNIHLYHPDGKLETSRRSIFAGAAPIDIPWVVNKEWGVEAGNMLVSGEPDDI
jgi:hypothetical protein